MDVVDPFCNVCLLIANFVYKISGVLESDEPSVGRLVSQLKLQELTDTTLNIRDIHLSCSN